MLLARREVKRREARRGPVGRLGNCQIGIVAGDQLDKTRFTSKVLHADLDMVDHQPPEPAYHRHGPGCCLAVANGDQRARDDQIQVVNLRAHAATRVTLVLDLPDLGNRVEWTRYRKRYRTGVAVGSEEWWKSRHAEG